MEFVDALILGLVQGITEFLPVSSSGHLILIRDLLSITGSNALAYDAMLHFATALAALIYFRSDIWVLVQVVLRRLGRLPVNERDLTLAYALIIGTIPAVLIGIILGPVFAHYLSSTVVVAGVLLCASIFFIYVEWKYYQFPGNEPVTKRRGFWVGAFQALALLPGFSRTGATIAGGMLLGLSRVEATRFSFLLAIPITIAFGTKKFLELLQLGGSVDWMLIVVGASTAFVVALFTIHYFLSFIKRHTLWPFIWYSLILSGFAAYVAFIAN